MQHSAVDTDFGYEIMTPVLNNESGAQFTGAIGAALIARDHNGN